MCDVCCGYLYFYHVVIYRTRQDVTQVLSGDLQVKAYTVESSAQNSAAVLAFAILEYLMQETWMYICIDIFMCIYLCHTHTHTHTHTQIYSITHIKQQQFLIKPSSNNDLRSDIVFGLKLIAKQPSLITLLSLVNFMSQWSWYQIYKNAVPVWYQSLLIYFLFFYCW